MQADGLLGAHSACPPKLRCPLDVAWRDEAQALAWSPACDETLDNCATLVDALQPPSPALLGCALRLASSSSFSRPGSGEPGARGALGASASTPDMRAPLSWRPSALLAADARAGSVAVSAADTSLSLRKRACDDSASMASAGDEAGGSVSPSQQRSITLKRVCSGSVSSAAIMLDAPQARQSQPWPIPGTPPGAGLAAAGGFSASAPLAGSPSLAASNGSPCLLADAAAGGSARGARARASAGSRASSGRPRARAAKPSARAGRPGIERLDSASSLSTRGASAGPADSSAGSAATAAKAPRVRLGGRLLSPEEAAAHLKAAAARAAAAHAAARAGAAGRASRTASPSSSALAPAATDATSCGTGAPFMGSLSSMCALTTACSLGGGSTGTSRPAASRGPFQLPPVPDTEPVGMEGLPDDFIPTPEQLGGWQTLASTLAVDDEAAAAARQQQVPSAGGGGGNGGGRSAFAAVAAGGSLLSPFAAASPAGPQVVFAAPTPAACGPTDAELQLLLQDWLPAALPASAPAGPAGEGAALHQASRSWAAPASLGAAHVPVPQATAWRSAFAPAAGGAAAPASGAGLVPVPSAAAGRCQLQPMRTASASGPLLAPVPIRLTRVASMPHFEASAPAACPSAQLQPQPQAAAEPAARAPAPTAAASALRRIRLSTAKAAKPPQAQQQAARGAAAVPAAAGGAALGAADLSPAQLAAAQQSQAQLMAMVTDIMQQRMASAYQAGFQAAAAQAAGGPPAPAAQAPRAAQQAPVTAAAAAAALAALPLPGGAEPAGAPGCLLADDILPSMQELLTDCY